jgi:hypothetical protein
LVEIYNNTIINSRTPISQEAGTTVIQKNNLLNQPSHLVGPLTAFDPYANRGPRMLFVPDFSIVRRYKLVSGSSMIDAGVNVGLPFTGAAPDVGSNEFIPATTTAPQPSPTATPAPTPAPAPEAASAPTSGSAPALTGRVLAISVDGLAPAALRRLGRAGTPWMHRMIARGASTLNARTELESTSTLPNHTGMLTGRRVRAAAGGHGVVFNEDDGSTVHRTAGEYVSSVFAVVHDHGGSTGLYASKDKFVFLDRSWDGQYGAGDRVGADDGRDKVDRYVQTEPRLLVDRVVRRLRSAPPRFALLHLRLPDSAGHAAGFLSESYLRAVRRTDALVGRVMSTVRRVPRLRRSTTVVLTADHGGHPGSRSHIDPTVLGNYRIPFVVWGAAAARGADLYRLNPDRRRPGDRRPSYRGRQPVRNGELANLVTDLLGLPAVPGSELNRRQTLDVRRR